MPYLLVDDTDGRVLAELEGAEHALRLCEMISRRNPRLSETLCVVHLEECAGSLAGVSTAITLRVLPELPRASGIADLRR